MNIKFMILLSSLTTCIGVYSEEQCLTAPASVAHAQWHEQAQSNNFFIRPRVAVVEINDNSQIQPLLHTLFAIAKDHSITGILLVIDHSGGKSGNLSVIHDMIKELSQQKPIVGLITGFAFSGGYFIASATNYLITHSLCEIGSIGVYLEAMRYHNPQLTLNGTKADLTNELFSVGKFKTTQHPFAPTLTDEEREYLLKNAEAIYASFLQLIARNRNLDLEQSSTWAEGQIFIAPLAVQLKLVDEIGTIFTAEQKLLELIKHKNPAFANAQDVELIYNQANQATCPPIATPDIRVATV